MKSRMAGFERDTLMAVWNSKRVWLIHVLANALIFAAFFYWLRISDDSGGYVAITVLMGAAIVLCTAWLHSATLNYFYRAHTGSSNLGDAMRATLARVPAFLVWTLIFGYILFVIGGAWEYDAQVGGWSRHVLPLFLRKHVSPRGMTSAFVFLVGLIFYFLVPIVLLPIAAQVSRFNFRGFVGRPLLDALRPVRELRFWIVYLLCFVIGMYLPYKLAYIDPKENASLHYQTFSMVVRLGVGYLLSVTAWLVVCSAITRAIKGNREVEHIAGVINPASPATA